jgi:hypothetical protein
VVFGLEAGIIAQHYTLAQLGRVSKAMSALDEKLRAVQAGK